MRGGARKVLGSNPCCLSSSHISWPQTMSFLLHSVHVPLLRAPPHLRQHTMLLSRFSASASACPHPHQHHHRFCCCFCMGAFWRGNLTSLSFSPWGHHHSPHHAQSAPTGDRWMPCPWKNGSSTCRAAREKEEGSTHPTGHHTITGREKGQHVCSVLLQNLTTSRQEAATPQSTHREDRTSFPHTSPAILDCW